MTDNTPMIRQRITLESPATYQGLVDALVGAPRQVPGDAEVVEVQVAYSMEELMSLEPGDETTEIEERVYITLEWDWEPTP